MYIFMHNKSGAKLQKFSHIRKRATQINIKNREIPKNLSAFIAFAYSPYPLSPIGEAIPYLISLVRQPHYMLCYLEQ